MISSLGLGFYFAAESRGPDWEGSGTFLVTHAGAIPPAADVLAALARASLPRRHLLVTTSGSTSTDSGSVRLVALSFDAFLASAAAVNAHLGATPADSWAHALPLVHVGGLGILARAHLAGSRVVAATDGRWEPRQFHARVTETGATLGALVPTQVHDLVAARLRAPSSLRAIVIGGARLEPSLYSSARELGWPCLPSYGMTETCSQVATAAGAAVGDAYPHVLPVLRHADLRVQTDGRILVRASSLLTCYVHVRLASGDVQYDDPKRDGWFETDDLGTVTAGGVEVIGRATDTVKVLGELVSLPAVESAIGRWLAEHGDWRARIADYAVVSVAHARRGSDLVLAVVPAQGGPTGDRLVHGLADALSVGLRALERPARIVAVDTIPRSALGKVQRARLSEGIQAVDSRQ